MSRNHIRSAVLLRWISYLALLLPLTLSAVAQDSGNDDQNKSFDARTTVGDMHLGSDATPRELGLPVYPGARLKKHVDDNNSNANLSLFTAAFGFKLVIANYDSDDSPNKIIAFYRDKLKKYGKVLECHTTKQGVTTHADNDDDSKSRELKCDGDNKGPVVELKVGNENNQHDVEIESAENGHGSTFALVYVRSRGKQADI
ncbi:MAG TPA: hypothetical protein VMB18_10505 [Terriglobales bacterium]|jgi:hypothetical protein|nr:hypothetical protein [Terriglobales bacterium]